MPSVLAARTFAATVSKTIVPGSRWGIDALAWAGRAISVLPLPVTQALARLNSKGVRLYDTMPLPEYAESPETARVPGDSAS